jgi:hypothetical protein
MHVTPLLFGASQLHVHASAILAEPLRFFRLIDEKASHNPTIAYLVSHHSIFSPSNWHSPPTSCFPS